MNGKRRGGKGTPEAQSSKPHHDAEVFLYTDGACSGNPGPGGWAFILHHPASGKILEASGAEKETTNNRMEMRALIQGLRKLKRTSRVHVVTDSSYLRDGLTKWIHNWKAGGWRRKTERGWKPVRNEDLWKELDELITGHDVTFELVRGHSGHEFNERCDELAVAAYQALKKG